MLIPLNPTKGIESDVVEEKRHPCIYEPNKGNWKEYGCSNDNEMYLWTQQRELKEHTGINTFNEMPKQNPTKGIERSLKKRGFVYPPLIWTQQRELKGY